MKFLASNNKRLVLPVILIFTFASLYFIFNLSSHRRRTQLKRYSKTPTYIIENTATVEQIEISRQEWETCLEPGKQPSEYLSIIIVTRVDNYAG